MNEPNGKRPDIAAYLHCTTAVLLSRRYPHTAFRKVVRSLMDAAQRDLDKFPTGQPVKDFVIGPRSHTTSGIWDKALAEYVEQELQGPAEDSAALTRLSDAGLGADELLDAFVQFVAAHHLNLVWSVANRATNELPGFSADGVFGLGWVGLTRTLRRYNPSSSRVSTLAVPKIRGSILDGIRNERPLPKRMSTYLNRVNEASDYLSRKSHGPASSQELAEYLVALENVDLEGLPIEVVAALTRKELAKLNQLTRAMGAVNATSYSIVDDANPALEIPDPGELEETVIMSLVSDAVRAAVTELPELLSDVVELVSFNELSFTAAAEILNLTPAQVSTAHRAALTALRTLLADLQPAAA